MTKEWFTANELAGLDGLPTSARRVRSKAENECWISRKRTKGKGLEFHIDSLPLATQQALAKKAAEDIVNSPIGHQAKAAAALKPERSIDKEAQIRGAQQLIVLPEKPRQRAEARLLILQVAKRYLQPYERSRQLVVGEKAFARAYTERSLDLPGWVYETVKTVSWMTLRRWQQTLDKHGAAALAGRYKPSSIPKVEAQADMANFLKAIVTSKPHLVRKYKHLWGTNEDWFFVSLFLVTSDNGVTILKHTTGTSFAFELGVLSTGEFRARVRLNSGWKTLQSSGVLNDDTWHTAIFKREGGILKLFLDGI